MIGPSVEIAIILALILTNGFLAMSEIAIVSARKTRLQRLADQGNKRAQVALELAMDPNRFLSTVQIGITLVGTLAGAFGGATVVNRLDVMLDAYPLLEPYSYEIAFAAVVGTITYLTLVIGELVPKRVALNNPERVSSNISRPMNFISVVAAPAVQFLSYSTEGMVRLLGIKQSDEVPATEEEITVLLAEGRQAGSIEAAEQDIVERVFRFGDQTVGSVMTPRTDIVFLDLEDDNEANRAKMVEQAHSRFVVCEGGLDNTLGIVRGKEMLAQLVSGRPLNIRECIMNVPFIPENTLALQILKRFKRTGEQIVLVVDEYGGVAGLVTLDDILEAIVGDIPWTGEEPEPDIIQEEEQTWLVDGMLPIEEFKDYFDLHQLPEEEEDAFRTIGGFMVTNLGRIPEVGDGFRWLDYRFEVVEMDGNRVERIRMRVLVEEASEEDSGPEGAE